VEVGRDCHRFYHGIAEDSGYDSIWVILDVSYAALQAHGIVNVALHREYPPGIIFIFFHGRKDLYHVLLTSFQLRQPIQELIWHSYICPE
jgi:hypothetical protein